MSHTPETPPNWNSDTPLLVSQPAEVRWLLAKLVESQAVGALQFTSPAIKCPATVRRCSPEVIEVGVPYMVADDLDKVRHGTGWLSVRDNLGVPVELPATLREVRRDNVLLEAPRVIRRLQRRSAARVPVGSRQGGVTVQMQDPSFKEATLVDISPGGMGFLLARTIGKDLPPVGSRLPAVLVVAVPGLPVIRVSIRLEVRNVMPHAGQRALRVGMSFEGLDSVTEQRLFQVCMRLSQRTVRHLT